MKRIEARLHLLLLMIGAYANQIVMRHRSQVFRRGIARTLYFIGLAAFLASFAGCNTSGKQKQIAEEPSRLSQRRIHASDSCAITRRLADIRRIDARAKELVARPSRTPERSAPTSDIPHETTLLLAASAEGEPADWIEKHGDRGQTNSPHIGASLWIEKRTAVFGDPIPMVVVLSNSVASDLWFSADSCSNVAEVLIHVIAARDGVPLAMKRPKVYISRKHCPVAYTLSPGGFRGFKADLTRWRVEEGWLPGKYHIQVYVPGLSTPGPPVMRLQALSNTVTVEIRPKSQ